MPFLFAMINDATQTGICAQRTGIQVTQVD